MDAKGNRPRRPALTDRVLRGIVYATNGAEYETSESVREAMVVARTWAQGMIAWRVERRKEAK